MEPVFFSGPNWISPFSRRLSSPLLDLKHKPWIMDLFNLHMDSLNIKSLAAGRPFDLEVSLDLEQTPHPDSKSKELAQHHRSHPGSLRSRGSSHCLRLGHHTW